MMQSKFFHGGNGGFSGNDLNQQEESPSHKPHELASAGTSTFTDNFDGKFPFGRRATQEKICMNLHDGAAFCMVQGQTGSGKSVLLNSVVLNSCVHYHNEGAGRNLVWVIIDPKRVGWLDFTSRCFVYTDPMDYLQVITSLCQLVDRRYQFMQDEGYTEYPVDADHPEIMLLLDEFAMLTTDPDLVKNGTAQQITQMLTQYTQKARQCKMGAIFASQKLTVDVLPNAIKNSCVHRIAMRVGDSMTAGNVGDIKLVPSHMLKLPGEFYYNHPTQTKDTWIRGRSFYYKPADIKKVMDRLADDKQPDFESVLNDPYSTSGSDIDDIEIL